MNDVVSELKYLKELGVNVDIVDIVEATSLPKLVKRKYLEMVTPAPVVKEVVVEEPASVVEEVPAEPVPS